MNKALDQLSAAVALDAASSERLRLEFGQACAERVRHLLEDTVVGKCLDALGAFLAGTLERAELEAWAEVASKHANQHQGSKSIDGCGHAAVSAAYAVANAVAGRARQAADYAAYAIVYAEGGYGAVADPESFAIEHRWQVAKLASLAGLRETHDS